MTSLKIGAVVLLMIGCFAGGWYSNRHEPVVETKIETVEKVVTKIVTEKVTTPDGGTKETTETTTVEDTKKKEKDAQPVPSISKTDTKYSVGIQWNPALLRDERYSPTGIDFGYRVLGNAWATAGYDWHTKEVTLGLRIDF